MRVPSAAIIGLGLLVASASACSTDGRPSAADHPLASIPSPSAHASVNRGPAFSLAPGCFAPAPFVTSPSADPNTHPDLAATVGQPLTVETTVFVQRNTPLTMLKLVVAEPGTIPSAGARPGDLRSHPNVDDSTAQYSTSQLPANMRTAEPGDESTQRHLSITFTPPSAGTFPLFALVKANAVGACAGSGSYGEDQIAQITAS
jgi:hypothetical protein